MTKESPTFLLSGVYRAGPACMKKNFAQPESLVTLWNENRRSLNRSSQYIYSNLGRHYREAPNWKPLRHRQITKLRLSQLKKSEITKLEECETTRGESFICTTFANICIHCSESKAAKRMKDLCLRNL